MIKIDVNQTITTSLVDKLSSINKSNSICLVIPNTKKQSSKELELVASKYPNVIISVTGGLNPQKKKFNNEHYQKRTYYKPLELSKIIKIFSSIERKISLSWTETQKVMFVYQELCNHMEYSECTVFNRDVSRNLAGLLYGKAVCSGFALILKEALDRLGIKNIYQNVEGHHSWNIAYIDGNYRALELTWDCYNKTKQGCGFMCFNQDKDFYKNKHHNITFEEEEREYPIVPYTVEELRKDYQIINRSMTLKFQDANNKPIKINGKNYTVKEVNGEIELIGPNAKKFERRDGTKFILVSAGPVKDLNKYYCFELITKTAVEVSRIYSEVPLDRLSSEYDYTIANGLLSRERLYRKIRNFNGYVGYIDKDQRVYYNSNFEKETLNIIR